MWASLRESPLPRKATTAAGKLVIDKASRSLHFSNWTKKKKMILQMHTAYPFFEPS